MVDRKENDKFDLGVKGLNLNVVCLQHSYKCFDSS